MKNSSLTVTGASRARANSHSPSFDLTFPAPRALSNCSFLSSSSGDRFDSSSLVELLTFRKGNIAPTIEHIMIEPMKLPAENAK